MRPSRLLLLASLVLAPVAAGAVDVPVTYTVDSTALKTTVSGTNLTFKLFTDAACTATAHTEVVTVDNVTLLSVLKRAKPKNGVKPPKTTEIRATLTGVAPAAPLYLTVTGTGITAVSTACQVQAATTVGAVPSTLVLKDANGTVLGPVTSGYVLLSDGSQLVTASPPSTGFGPQGTSFAYVSVDCTGPKLNTPMASYGLMNLLPSQNGLDGTTLYYGPLTGTMTTFNSFDYSPEIAANCTNPGQIFVPPNRCCCSSPVCNPGNLQNTLAAPGSMDISGFVPPFSLSFQ